MQIIKGGFNLSDADRNLLNTQRAITAEINNRFITVGAVMLKNASKHPFDDDGWFKKLKGDTNLQQWIDDPELEQANVGFNLQQGWVDIDIDADDPSYNACVVAALNHLGVDTRFKFGRLSVGVPSHVMVQLGEEESNNFNELKRYEPREFRFKDKRYHVQIRSMPTNVEAKNLNREAKQTVMPGSIYTHKKLNDTFDFSVWYDGESRPAKGVRSIASTTPRRVNFNEIIRAVAFGTFLFFMKEHWVEGNRQMFAHKVTGWLARLVFESQALNNHEVVANEVFCPVDTHDIAESMLALVCEYQGDDEKHMRIRAYRDAVEKLERNPDAKVPGWPAMEAAIGGEAVTALRTVMMPGSDVSKLTKLAERYVYDENDDVYIDRDRFWTSGSFAFESPALERRHKSDTIQIKGKSREAFKIFEGSEMRKRVGIRNLYPDLEPGSINRITALDEVLREDQEDRTSLTVFNTWRGWPIAPAQHVDMALMNTLVGHLDWVLSLLTRDKKDQMDWIKKWLAFTLKCPGDKQQIAWVCVGGQGVGKSWFGNHFVKALFGTMWGTASPAILEDKFNISPFRDKMFVFIDEAKFYGEAGTEEVKKLIRNVDVAGQEKFENARNHKIYARLMFASNKFEMGIGQANVRDRALFYTMAYDKEHLQMTEMEFRIWSETLKPRFQEFHDLIKRKDAREHLMRYFTDIEVNRFELESIKDSSSGEAAIVQANMSWARRIAKFMVEEGRIHEDLDITWPFSEADVNRRTQEVAKDMGMRNVQGSRVLHEFMESGLTENVKVGHKFMFRFTHKMGDLVRLFGDAIGVPLEARYEFTEEDYGRNDCDGTGAPKMWRGGGSLASRKF